MRPDVKPEDFILANPLGTVTEVVAVSEAGIIVAQLAYGGQPFLIGWDEIGDRPEQWTHVPKAKP